MENPCSVHEDPQVKRGACKVKWEMVLGGEVQQCNVVAQDEAAESGDGSGDVVDLLQCMYVMNSPSDVVKEKASYFPYTVNDVAEFIRRVVVVALLPALVLGNGFVFSSVSLYNGRQVLGKAVPLVYQSSNMSSSAGSSMNLCPTGTLDPKTMVGKIVVCDRGITAHVAKGSVVKAAGGAGMILANIEANREELVAECHMLPASAVGQKEGEAIKKYIKSTANPTSTIIFKGTILGVKPSPVVADFSSRGPNIVNPEILKPDVIVHGVNIIAAWTGSCGYKVLDEIRRSARKDLVTRLALASR